jgi:hypothetical protein
LLASLGTTSVTAHENQESEITRSCEQELALVCFYNKIILFYKSCVSYSSSGGYLLNEHKIGK